MGPIRRSQKTPDLEKRRKKIHRARPGVNRGFLGREFNSQTPRPSTTLKKTGFRAQPGLNILKDVKANRLLYIESMRRLDRRRKASREVGRKNSSGRIREC